MSTEPLDVEVAETSEPTLEAGSMLELAVPPDGELVKHETRVVAWVQPLGEAGRVFIKVYLKRGRRAGIRVKREHDGLADLHRARVPCTEPVFWGLADSPRLGRVEIIATRMIDGAMSVREVLKEPHERAEELDFSLMFEAVHGMHDAGVHHFCLSTKNMLVDRAGKFYICDLAKSARYPAGISGTRMALFDYAHLCSRLSEQIGIEPCRQALSKSFGPQHADRVIRKTKRFTSRNGLQHKRLRGEFILRHALSRWSARPRATREA